MRECPLCDEEIEDDECMRGDVCMWCDSKRKFSEFAESCGLNRYPDPTGERYVYKLDGSSDGKKVECTDLIDELWNALASSQDRHDLRVNG